MERSIVYRYSDPLELIWTRAASDLGIRIVRDPEVFVSWDGSGTLRIGTAETLDADDSLAQLILHEICHALVAGPDAIDHEDWGLDYEQPDHAVFEHAALRVQAALAARFGLRSFLAATTKYRGWYDGLPEDPLAGDDASVPLALDAWQRANAPPWEGPLSRALEATRMIAEITGRFAGPDSLWRFTG